MPTSTGTYSRSAEACGGERDRAHRRSATAAVPVLNGGGHLGRLRKIRSQLDPLRPVRRAGRSAKCDVSLPVRVATAQASVRPAGGRTRTPTMTVAGLLPELCVDHGLPAVAHHTRIVRLRVRGTGRWHRAPARLRLRADWPVCRRCVRRSRRLRWLAWALLLRGSIGALVLVATLFSLGHAGSAPQLFAIPAAWAAGSVLMAAYVSHRSAKPARCRPGMSTSTIVVSAHPDFAAAAAACLRLAHHRDAKPNSNSPY